MHLEVRHAENEHDKGKQKYRALQRRCLRINSLDKDRQPSSSKLQVVATHLQQNLLLPPT